MKRSRSVGSGASGQRASMSEEEDDDKEEDGSMSTEDSTDKQDIPPFLNSSPAG